MTKQTLREEFYDTKCRERGDEDKYLEVYDPDAEDIANFFLSRFKEQLETRLEYLRNKRVCFPLDVHANDSAYDKANGYNEGIEASISLIRNFSNEQLK